MVIMVIKQTNWMQTEISTTKDRWLEVVLIVIVVIVAISGYSA